MLDPDATYAVAQYPGVAFYFAGAETRPDEDTDWTGIEQPTGFALMVMVGDDYKHRIDPDDCTPIDRDDYCGGCGQIGCKADAYGESE